MDKEVLANSGKEVILLDPLFYLEQNTIEISIINFIISHFWWFISDIKKIYLANKMQSKIFDCELYERVTKEYQKHIEFPYSEHRTRGGGGYGFGVEGWGKMQEGERTHYYNRSSLLDEELRILILTYLNSRIVGYIFCQLADTSAGFVLGIKIKLPVTSTCK
ncbi:MAG: hypothetical protein IPN79_00420 [Saprospiraceae bacterium]|nr:hypothetical protein [Saprospiraceae bacterium]